MGLAGEELRKIIGAVTGRPCLFYVLGKDRPVERLTGVIAWGEKSNEPGSACFGFRVPRGTPEIIVPFLESFRQFVLGQRNATVRQLHFAELVCPEAPAYELLTQAGFAPGLVNESYLISMARVRDRLNAMRQRFSGKLDPPPGFRISFPERSHLPGLLRLCSRLHHLMIPGSVSAAFEKPGGMLAGFAPGLSGVYLEGDIVRGAMLVECRDDCLRVPALVADPSATMPSSRIYQWLLAHFVETTCPLAARECRLSTDPASHPATKRLVARMGGRRLAVRYRMEASRTPIDA